MAGTFQDNAGIMNFEFATANRILFGKRTSDEIATAARNMGSRVFVVTGKNTDRISPILKQVSASGIDVTLYRVSGEPITDVVLEAVADARKNKCDMVIGIGGGSVIDTGKVVAALLTNKGDLTDYLEVIGKGKKINKQPAPYIAVATTAGTGAEVTRNSVIGSLKHNVKVSMRSPMMLPKLAIVDPLLTLSVPKEITATTGLDALTQLIEPFVSKNTNPLTDGVCREGIIRAAGSIKKAYNQGDNIDARENMSLASLFSGIALANAKLGAVHGFAGPIGGMFNAPHGAICANLLPIVIESNVDALKMRSQDSPAIGRFDEVAGMVTGSSSATAPDLIAWIRTLCDNLNLPPLSAFGIKKSDIPAIIKKSKASSSMKGNPVDLTEDELAEILNKAL